MPIRETFGATVAVVSGALFAIVSAPYYAVRYAVTAPVDWYRRMKGIAPPNVEVPLLSDSKEPHVKPSE